MALENSAGLGVRNTYGPRVVDNPYGGELPGNGAIRQAEYVFTYDNLPVASTLEMELLLPDNSTVVDVYWITEVAFAGGTSYDVDFVDTAGSAIGTGLDKVFDALLLASTNVIGETVRSSTHAGTNSGNALGSALVSPAQLLVAATGTYTAGKARIVIDYIPYKGA